MIGGAVLVALGFIGFAFCQNKNVVEPDHDATLEGRLQQRYGFAKDQARKDVDTWFSTLK
jgi:hypothetical protein